MGDFTGNFFLEGGRYTGKDLLGARIGEDSQGDSIPSDLLLLRIDKVPVLDIEGNAADPQAATYRFNFVGVLSYKGFVFSVLPKCFGIPGSSPNDPPTWSENADLKTLMEWSDLTRRSIEVYNENRPDKSLSDEDERHLITRIEVESDSKLALWLAILNDYYQQGPYSIRRHVYERNGPNAIDWRRTIDSQLPYTSKGGVAYLDVVTKKTIRDDDNVVRTIQEAIVSEILAELRRRGLLTILRCSDVRMRAQKLRDIGNDAYRGRMLHIGLAREFQTDKRILIQHLIEYEEGLNKNDKREEPLFTGTTKYDRVWEDACQFLFRDQYNLEPDDSRKLERIRDPQWVVINAKGEKLGAPNKQAEDEKHVAGDTKPEEEGQGAADKQIKTDAGALASDEGGVGTTSGLIPDIVHYDRRGKKLYILDAKYYLPEYPQTIDGTLRRQPGVGDIVKQYMYALGIKDRYRDESIVVNAFLLPVYPGNREGKGYLQAFARASVEFTFVVDTLEMALPKKGELLAEVCAPIRLVELSFTRAMRQYIRRSHEGDAYLKDVIDSIEIFRKKPSMETNDLSSIGLTGNGME